MIDDDNFDYQAIRKEEKRDELRSLATRLRLALRMTTEQAAKVGGMLREAKSILPHGQFGVFCSNALGLDRRLAQIYMNLSKFVDRVGQDIVKDLPLGVAHKLAAGNAPEPIVSAVVASVKSGQRVTRASVMARICARADTAKAIEVHDRVEELIVSLQVVDRGVRVELANFLGSADQVLIAAFAKRLVQDLVVESTSLAPMESQGRLFLEGTNDWGSKP